MTLRSQSNTSTSSPRYTPSTTPSYAQAEGDVSRPTAVSTHTDDPDTPLPSVEPVFESSTSSQRSTTIRTPSSSTRSTGTSQNSTRESLSRQVRGLHLASPTPVSASSSSPAPTRDTIRSRTSSTPSIQVTHTPPPTSPSVQDGRTRTDSLVQAIDALHVQGSPARSPSPSRRRRSGSNIIREKHRIEDEEPPQSLFHQREVQESLTGARAVMDLMAQALASSNLHREQGSAIQRLYQQVVNLSEFQPPASRIVGLVGDSGVGKSSLINSLLDLKEFARASNSGAACTCVVTEYHFHSRDDSIILIDYFSPTELRQQYEQLLRAYREHATSAEEDMPAIERDELQRMADLAMNTFKASFRRRLDNNPNILLSMPLGEALDSMMTWVSQILTQEGVNWREGQLRETFGDVRQCSSRLKVLTSEADGAGPSFWPFIRKIRVYIRSHILSKGLIIADLPGLRDLNSARQNVTERYVRQCHQIFAIARIGRATTDAGVQEVFALARRASLKNVGVICTQSDDIRASEARNDWPEETNRISEMMAIIDHEKNEHSSLEAELHSFNAEQLSEDERQDFIEIQQELNETKLSLKRHELDLQRHIITTRNRKVSNELQRRNLDSLSEEALKTFCVSNVLYWEQRNNPVSESKPFLELSGILDLRRHCIGIVAESHLRATVEYIRDEIPALLGSIELWIQAGSGNTSAERKQQILDAVSSVQRHMDELTSPDSEVGDIAHTLKHKFDVKIRSYMGQHATQWSAGASNASGDWLSWHHTSFAAFCRKYGDHYTNAIGSRCWNEEAMITMKRDMTDLLNEFLLDVESCLAGITTVINDTCTSVVRATMETANSDQGLRNALRTLTNTLRHQNGLLRFRVESTFEDFQTQVSTSQTDVLSPVRTSIIGQFLENTYRTANAEYGGGSDRRRKTIIRNGFCSPSLFTNQRRRFRDEFSRISDDLERNIRAVIAEQFALIEANLDTLRNDNVVLESERNPDFRMRLAAELGIMRGRMEHIRRAIDEVTQSARQDIDMED